MLIGYIRATKRDWAQNLDLQKNALLAAGVEETRIYYDCAPGKRDDCPGLQSCLKSLQLNDTLVVWKLDRLGRNLKHLITVIDELRERHIGFKVLTGQGAHIDTTTANGRLVFDIFAALAEFERELIIERTYTGLNAARARGRYGGRPRKMDATLLRRAMAAMREHSSVAYQVAQKLNVTTATLYTYVNGDGTLKPAGERLLGKDNIQTNIRNLPIENVRTCLA